ncbi:MAG: hypothetical protein Fur0037_16060 [Planctomycetota bacterium]
MSRSFRALLAAPLLLGLPALPAQSLQFDLRGGSMPGSLSMDLYPGAAPFYPCFVLVGLNAGPTPLSIVDPADPRSVQVGTQMLGQSIFGLFAMDLHFRAGPTPVPSSPGLLDLRLVFQGITFPGATTLVDQISPAHAIYLAPAGACRDRSVYATDERAFAVTLPRRDGKWMVVGGGRGGLLSQVAHATTEIYDELTDSFGPGPRMTTERSLHTATRLLDGRWLICGGVDRLNDPQAACEIYDPATDQFTAAAPMLSPRMGHSATLLSDGRVFVAGGLQAMTVVPTPISAIFDTTDTTEIYDPATGLWSPGPNLRTPRAAHAAILRPDGMVLLCGGISWDQILFVKIPAVRSTTDLFDPVAGTIAAGPSMGSARSLTDATEIAPGRWLLAGGISGLTLTNLGTPTSTAEVYDAATNSFSPAGAMATARGNHRVIGLGGGRWLHLGGANGNIMTPNPLSSGEIYDAASNSWSVGPSLTIPRAGYATFETPTGQVQIFGGGTSGGVITTLTEWYYF